MQAPTHRNVGTHRCLFHEQQSPSVPLIFLGVFSLGYATFWCFLVRGFGGRRELLRSRRGLPTRPDTRSWESLPLITRYWMRLVPALVVLGVAAVVAGVVVEVA